ncbi:hypothetical protein KQI86_16660 [Clostridium sp. MSJ-11]|uniref:Uncharacterized protein n=1 Tax=Clostridium mobile TaxID=2841512 RepID=A0ABS6EL67_9CLOT|nr:hypothetical protein [Clostridium mobile]MBU5485954.1 hypothetical protein [Clostridium mobile]
MLQYDGESNEPKINNIEKGFNLKVIDFRKNLSDVIDNCNLPAIVIRMVLQEFTQEVNIQTQQIIQREQNEYNKLKDKDVNNTK